MDLKSPVFTDLQEEQPKRTEAEQESAMVQRYYLRFLRAEKAVKPKHELFKTLDTFDRGEQWKDVPMPPWIPKPVTNYIRYVRTTKRANLAAEIPKAAFSPVHPDDSEVIHNLQLAYDHVWEESKINRVVRRCIDRGTLQGTSWAYVYYDPDYVGGKYYGKNDPRNQLFEGKICVKRFPNAQIFPDPDSYTLQGCKFIEITENISLNTVKNNPEFRKYAGDKLDTVKGRQLDTNTDATGDIYNRDYNITTNSSYGLQGEEMVTLHTHFERYLNENGKWQLDITYYIRNNNFALLRLEDVQPNVYPFAPYYDEEEENDIWGTSQCMDILENQKALNKLSQTATIISTMHQNPQKVVQRDSGINAQELARTGTLAGKVWQSNIPNPIEFLQHPDIPNGLFTNQENLKAEIKEMAGLNEAYTGQSVGSLTTSTGVDSLIERASVRDKDKSIGQIDPFVEDLSHIIMLFIVYHWKEERPISKKMPNGGTQFQEFKPVDKLTAENLDWRVVSNVYAKSPMTQAAKRQQADKLMQMQGQFQFNPPIITPEEWIQMQDFDSKDQILARMEEDRQKLQQQDHQNMVQQIMAFMQQAQAMAQKGQPQDQINQQLQQQVTQLLQQTQSTGASQTTDGAGNPVNAPQDQGTPQGVTSQVAMQNMANGH
jgi:hypothetical protein